jgi:hypothetical protein
MARIETTNGGDGKMHEEKKTLLFFDLGLSGDNPVFSQPTSYASLRTTMEGEVLRSRKFRVKLRKDVVPILEVLHSIAAFQLDSEECVTEYEAACRIHQELSEPGTIALGFNSFGLAHEACRFMFFRNLLDPFAQEKAGCRRGDILPILVLFKIFAPEVLKFPVGETGVAKFMLEEIASENGLGAGNEETPAESVGLMNQLIRLMREGNPKVLEAALNRFSPNEDRKTIDGLKTVRAKRREVKAGILLSHRGHNKNYQLPAVLARTEKNDRQLWLLLENDFDAYLKGDQACRPYIMTRKPGEVPFVLRPEKGLIEEERKDLIRKNLKVIEREGVEPFLEGMRPEFEDHPNLDLDAGLYIGDVAGEFEASSEGIHRFHNALMPEMRWSTARSLPSERFQKLGLRAFFRNEFHCDQAKRARDDFFQSQLSMAQTVDHRGRERRTVKHLQSEIEKRVADSPSVEELSVLGKIARRFSIVVKELEDGKMEAEVDQAAPKESSEPEKAGREETPMKANREKPAKGKQKRVKKTEAPFGVCECGEPLVERLVLVVDSKCWNCSEPMKVAMTGSQIGGGQIGDPEGFSEEETEYARSQGAIIETRTSETQGRSYPANVCGSCNQMTGAFYVASHSPGQMEMVEGLAPSFTFRVFGTECPRCEMEREQQENG